MENEKIPYILNTIINSNIITTGVPYIEKNGDIKKIYYQKSITNNEIEYDSVCVIDSEFVKYNSRTGITEYGDQIYIEIRDIKKPQFVKHNYDLIWFYSSNISEDQWDYVLNLVQDKFDEDADICSYYMIKPDTYYYYDFLYNDFKELNTNINIPNYGIEIK